MKIVILTSEYKTEQAPHGGISSLVDSIYDMLSTNHANKVSLISTRSWRKSLLHRRIFSFRSWLRPIGTEISFVEGVPVTYVGSNWVEIEAMRYRTTRSLRKLVSDSDLVIAISGTPVFFGLLRGLKSKTLGYYATFLADERSAKLASGNLWKMFLGKVNLRLLTALETKSLQIPNLVCALTEDSKKRAIAKGQQSVFLLPPSVDESFFTIGKVHKNQNSSYLLWVSRLNDPRKNLSTLLDSFFYSRRIFGLDQKLILAGSGSLSPQIEKQIIDSGNSEFVEVIINPSYKKIRDLYQNASCLVLSSEEEGFGIVLVEAMACGTSFLSTNTVGASEVHSSTGVGKIVPLGNGLVRNIALEMSKLSTAEQTLKRRKEVRSAFIKTYSRAAISGKLNAVVELLIH